ncbi:hypothetical protein KY290_024649 [Solanum tuberosum]|uniref:Putative plant transposon protein domain-containing protein n=1 Tax=Solanum tuberosum TaxID=4113 RepID=A0ABQ7UR97_SOLTU|nr:hypothetical protein KY284_023494 [Solanum tuberosum]KAH0754379.1 hypothetical protein KY290_024649 [Solanum tuberosum]
MVSIWDRIMSSSQSPGKAVATSSQRKCVRSVGNVPPAPAFPRAKTGGHLGAGVPTDIEADQGVAYGVYLCRAGRVQLAHGPRILCQLGTEHEIVTVRGVNVPITPAGINDILGTPQETNLLVLTGLKIRPPYRAIQHTLCGPQSMAQCTKHSGRRYHQSLPYAHRLRETRVWLKTVMNCLISGLHYTDITRDRVCLVYALMTAIELTFGAVMTRKMIG